LNLADDMSTYSQMKRSSSTTSSSADEPPSSSPPATPPPSKKVKKELVPETPKAAKSPKKPRTPKAPKDDNAVVGQWTPEKRESFMDLIIANGYKSTDLNAVAEEV
jgi:hypothetical protein